MILQTHDWNILKKDKQKLCKNGNFYKRLVEEIFLMILWLWEIQYVNIQETVVPSPSQLSQDNE